MYLLHDYIRLTQLRLQNVGLRFQKMYWLGVLHAIKMARCVVRLILGT